MNTSVAGEAGDFKELEVLLQAASEGSEDIRLERSLRTIRLIHNKSLRISDALVRIAAIWKKDFFLLLFSCLLGILSVLVDFMTIKSTL